MLNKFLSVRRCVSFAVTDIDPIFPFLFVIYASSDKYIYDCSQGILSLASPAIDFMYGDLNLRKGPDTQILVKKDAACIHRRNYED